MLSDSAEMAYPTMEFLQSEYDGQTYIPCPGVPISFLLLRELLMERQLVRENCSDSSIHMKHHVGV